MCVSCSLISNGGIETALIICTPFIMMVKVSCSIQQLVLAAVSLRLVYCMFDGLSIFLLLQTFLSFNTE